MTGRNRDRFAQEVKSTMSTEPNPYDSPRGMEEPHTWWSRLQAYFFPPPPKSLVEKLLAGSRGIFHGVVFHVNVYDDSMLFALLPLGANERRRIRNNIREAQRVLHLLLAKYPELVPPFQHRNLVVVLISEYGTSGQELHREFVPVEVWQASKERSWLDEEPEEKTA